MYTPQNTSNNFPCACTRMGNCCMFFASIHGSIDHLSSNNKITKTLFLQFFGHAAFIKQMKRDRNQVLNVFYRVCVFRAVPPTKLIVLMLDLLRYFLLSRLLSRLSDSSKVVINFTSGLQGSVNIHRGALLLVPQWQCISSFVFYITSFKSLWY